MFSGDDEHFELPHNRATQIYRFFIQHHRAPLAIVVFFLLCLVGVFQLNPGIVFAKLQSDSAVYFTQAKYLWENGTAWNFTLGDGLPPIIFSPVPAYIRAPIFGITSDPVAIVRLIEIENIIILALLAAVSWLYLNLRLPNDLRTFWSYTPFVYIPLTYNPWVLNAILPLGDHIYALLCMGSIVLLLSISKPLTQPKSLCQAVGALVLIVIAVIQKFTGIGLLVFVIRLFARSKNYWRWFAVCGLLAGVLIFYFYSIYSRYVEIGLSKYLAGRSIVSMLADTFTNLIVAAIPNQILPNFGYLFSRDFAATNAVLFSALTVQNIPWVILGASITCLVLLGLWHERHRMAPEIALLMAVVPIFAIVNNSTSRYLASLQPIFIVFFIIGFSAAWSSLFKFNKKIGYLMLGLLSAVIIDSIALNMAKSFTARPSAVVLDLIRFIDELGTNFIDGHAQIASISKSNKNVRFALVGDEIRWYGLADVNFIAPEQSKKYLCAGFPVYTVLGCDKRNCDRLLSQYKKTEDNIFFTNGLSTSDIPIYEKKTHSSLILIKKLSVDAINKCPH